MSATKDPRQAVVDAIERMGPCTVYVEQDDQGRPRAVRLVEVPPAAAERAREERAAVEHRVTYLERRNQNLAERLATACMERDSYKAQLEQLRSQLAELARGAA